MRITDRDLSLYPDDLLSPSGSLIQNVDRRWWGLYTKPGQEKRLARELAAARIPFYLPLAPKWRVSGGRRLRSQLPLFTGYLFLFGTDQERLRAVATNRLSQLLRVEDPQTLLRDLRQIHRAISCGVPLVREQRPACGARMRVCSGPLAGLEGCLQPGPGGQRLILGVDLLQQGVSLKVDERQHDLAPLT